MQIILEAYLAFLTLIFLGLLSLNLLPRKTERYKNQKGFRPKALLIVPCRGMDLTLHDNLSSLKHQGYGNYDLVAVVDSERDESLKVIRQLSIRYIISDYKSGGSGKVCALCSAISKFRKHEIYAVADSDIIAGRDWLVELVAPLSDKRIGITTSFPYFNPMGGFWSRVKELWGFVGQGLMESSRTRFAWGGSLAFRRELLDGKSFNFFSGMVSDDIALTRITRSKGLGIAYVRAAQPTINTRDNFSQFVEWSNRQTSFSISGYRANLYYGLAFYLANILLLISGVALTLVYTPLYLILLIPLLIGLARSYQRQRVPRPGTIPLYFIMYFIYLANLIVASRMSSVHWRGRQYRVK